MVRVTLPLVNVSLGTQVLDSVLEWTLTFDTTLVDGSGGGVAAAAPGPAPVLAAAPGAGTAAVLVQGAALSVTRLSGILGVEQDSTLTYPEILRGQTVADIAVPVFAEAVERRVKRDGRGAVTSIPLASLPKYDHPKHVLNAIGVAGHNKARELAPGRPLHLLAYFLVAQWPDPAVWARELNVMLDVSVASSPFK